jgi:penicillin amidase
MKRLQAVGSGIVLAALLYVGFLPAGPLPALGSFLDPTDGVWATARSATLPAERSADVTGLGGAVRVVFDDRAVPHIFAATLEDAARALGYVTARDRLFQLEMQTRATAGTLSEILGNDLLEADRQQRALGLAWSAEQVYAGLGAESRTVRVLEAYADGVNAWIDALRPRDYPLEYRLLGAEPMRWRPVYSAYLIRYMGQVLSYNTHDRWRERVEALIGPEAAAQLFPVNSPIQEPVIPFAGATDREDDPLEEDPTDSIAAVNRASVPRARPVAAPTRPLSRSPAEGSGEVVVGSNNWAVAPARAEAGFALLAGDPHLELTLPSIWYEAHLVVPGQLNVYGATIPGAPVVAVGFNRQVAWSFTNVEADLIDFYAETLDDPDTPTAYVVDGEWRPLTHRVEEFRGKRGQLLATDTVYFTHRGPLRWFDGRPLSTRWVVLEAEDDLEPFLGMAKAGSVSEWLTAVAGLTAIAQNGAVVDWLGNVAIRTAGRFPIRPDSGFRVLDGSTAQNDWLGYLPPERLPTAVNPPQGFVASANQQPVHPHADSTYFGVNWPSPWRAMRINELLRADAAVTAEDMMRFQTDPGSARADRFVPAFLEAAQRTLSEFEGGDSLRQALALLTEWDRRYTRENERAVLFELAMDELAARTWDELRAPAPDGAAARRVATPTEAVLANLLAAPLSPWWDDRTTPSVVENRDAVLNASLVAALATAGERYGAPDGGGWRWDRIRRANIYHLLRLPALSALELSVQGGPGTLNPVDGSGRWGASWRMVVELRPEVRAWTTYPGGQSGNPASRWYRDRLDRWLAGELDPVLFPAQPGDLAAERVLATWTLRPPPGAGS